MTLDNPLTAFVIAETALAVRLVQMIHSDLLITNRSLKSNSPLPVALMQSAADIAMLKVSLDFASLFIYR